MDEFDFDAHKMQAIEQYECVRPKYKRFAETAKRILDHALRKRDILFHKIEDRAKEIESFGNKAIEPMELDQTKPKYSDPLRQIEDLAGVRVITFLHRDVDEVCKCIECEFYCQPKDDKSERLRESDKFGYQSIHYIAQLHPDRIKLPEYNEFGGLKLEIQVRTILQHAWAEIEHDIQYKSTEPIPPLIRRRFMSLAGLLEIADREFQELHDADKGLRREVQEKHIVMLDQEINQINLGTYLHKVFPERDHSEQKYVSEIIDELLKENLKYIRDIDALIQKYPLETYVDPLDKESGIISTDVGIIRSLLVARKIDEINEVIESWKPLPSIPKNLKDYDPFMKAGGRIASYLIRSDDDIKIWTTNAGTLEITNEELGNRIGTGLPYLRRLKDRLVSFRTYMLSKAQE